MCKCVSMRSGVSEHAFYLFYLAVIAQSQKGGNISIIPITGKSKYFRLSNALLEGSLLRIGGIHGSVFGIRLIISLAHCIHVCLYICRCLCMSTHVPAERLSSLDLSSANLYGIVSQFRAGCVSDKCDYSARMCGTFSKLFILFGSYVP